MSKAKVKTKILSNYGHLPLGQFSREDATHLFTSTFGIDGMVCSLIEPVGTIAVNKGRPLPSGMKASEYLCVADLFVDYKKNKIAIVGKGVCFDSGGMNIKTGSHMYDMKFDKLGALNAMDIGLALWDYEQGQKHNYLVICPFVENLVSPTAQHPGDVITYDVNSKPLRVEVTNTDAEGRLILADGLLEAQARGANIIIDLATLTGHVSYALGDGVVGVLGNNKSLATKLIKVFKRHKVDAEWLEIRDSVRKSIECKNKKVADIVNSSTSHKAGCQEGAAFLEKFIYKKGVDWIHLDIAGIADKDGKVFTGLVAPLVEFIKGLK